MHDRKLLSDSEFNAADLAEGQNPSRMASAMSPAALSAKRRIARMNFWAVMGFCAVGLVCSVYVPATYLQAAALIG